MFAWFSNMKVGTKLMTVIIVLTLVVAGLVGGLGYFNLSQLSNVILQITDQRVPSVKNATAVERYALRTIMDEKRYLLSVYDVSVDQAAIERGAMDNIAEIIAALDKVDAVAKQYNDQDLLAKSAEVRTVTLEYKDLYTQGVAKLQANVLQEQTMADKGALVVQQAQDYFNAKLNATGELDRQSLTIVVDIWNTALQTRLAAVEEPLADPAIYEASDPLEWWDVRQYLADVTSGNHSLWHMVKLISRAGYAKLLNIGVGYGILLKFYNSWQKLRGGAPFPTIEGRIRKGQPTPNEILDLAPGEWVEVKSGEEIAATITLAGFNRGMRYDPEMLKYSGNRYRVQQRVDQLIDEKSGKMVRMKSPCIQLENVYCRAEFTPDRLGCPRASNTYWREIWLKRVADSQSDRLEQL